MEGEIDHEGQVERDELDDLIDEVFWELTGANETPNLTVEMQDQSKEVESEWIELQDHAEGKKFTQQSQMYDIIDVELLEHEHKCTDNPNEYQLRDCSFYTRDGLKLVVERQHLKADQVSWTKEQNHAQIHVPENKGASDGQIQLRAAKDQQEHTARIKDEINGKSLIDQIGGRGNVVLQEDCTENPIFKEVIENQIQPCQTELTLVLHEPQRQESDEIEQMCESDCRIVVEENHLNKALEVLEELNQHIEQPELIYEQTQLHCVLVDRERKNVEDFEKCDELKNPENENSEDHSLPEKTQEDEELPHEPHNEDEDKLSDKITTFVLEQTTKIVDHHQPMKESMDDSSIMVKPQGRKLRPRPLKFESDLTEEQFEPPSFETSSGTNQGHKLRPRPSKNESVEVKNRAESLAMRPEHPKRRN